jgi:hypothetical protein
MAKVTPRKVQSIGITFVKCKIIKPSQLVSGPGKMGKKEPIIPKQTKKKPSNSKKISIVNFIIRRKNKTVVTINSIRTLVKNTNKSSRTDNAGFINLEGGFQQKRWTCLIWMKEE